jgi:hypothetical protein
MNLPSSLALPQSKLFQSRIFLVLLLVLAVLIGAGVFYFTRPVSPPKAPTVATSPDAVATPRPKPVAASAPVPAPIVYGPPAPDWVERVPMPSAPGAPLAAATAVPAPGGAVTATTPLSAASTGAVAQTGALAGTDAAGIVASQSAAQETPQSLDPSVLFARESYLYTSGGRRDPFQSLLDGKYQSASGDGALVDVGDIHLVGIMWGSADKYALVEDSRGRGFVLRVGDPVLNGYISGITKSEIQVVQNAFGESQTLSIQLKPKEGDENATRN